MVTTEHHQTDFLGGYNKLTFQYATDSMIATREGRSSALAQNEGKMFRFIDHGVIPLGSAVEMFYVGIYEDRDFDNDSGGEWMSVGVRPTYFWSPVFSTALEVGYDNVSFDDGSDDADLTKLTLAQQWSAGDTFFARPVIRLFATYAMWDEESYNAASDSIGPDEGDGLTFGAQAEVWW